MPLTFFIYFLLFTRIHSNRCHYYLVSIILFFKLRHSLRCFIKIIFMPPSIKEGGWGWAVLCTGCISTCLTCGCQLSVVGSLSRLMLPPTITGWTSHSVLHKGQFHPIRPYSIFFFSCILSHFFEPDLKNKHGFSLRSLKQFILNMIYLTFFCLHFGCGILDPTLTNKKQRSDRGIPVLISSLFLISSFNGN